MTTSNSLTNLDPFAIDPAPLDALDDWAIETPALAPPAGAHFVWGDALSGNFVGTGWLNNGILGVPGAGDTADMSVKGADYTVLVDNVSITSDGGTWNFTDYTLGNVILGVDTTLEIDPNSFDLQTGGTNNGEILVDYVLTVGNTGSNVAILSGGGGGQINLNDNYVNATLTGYGSGAILDLRGQTIVGAGTISNLILSIDKHSAIDATGSKNQFILNPGNTIYSEGTIGANGSSTLVIENTTIDESAFAKGDSAGIIETITAGATIDLYSVHIEGGGIYGYGGAIQVLDNASVIDGSTSAGAVTILGGGLLAANGDTLTMKGLIYNHGNVAIQGGTTLQIDATSGATFSSGGVGMKGTLTFDDNAYNNINTNGSGSTLTNVDNTISGSVHFYYTTIVNQAGGTIDATGTNYQIIIDATDVLKNSGLIEATGAAGLYIGNQLIDGALGGMIVAGAGSLIDIASDTFEGGVISSVGTGQWVITDTGNVLDGSTKSGAVTLTTTLAATAGDTLTLKGTIHNEGTLAIKGGTTLQIDATTGATLDSGGLAKKGSVTFDDNAYNNINTNGSSSTLTNVDNTISGSVHFYNTHIVNDVGGTIDATGTNYQIIIDGTDTLKNYGLIEATGAAGLAMSGEVIDSALGGTIVVGNGSSIDIGSDTFEGGVISAIGTGQWVLTNSANVLDGSTTSGAVTLKTTLAANGGDTLTLKGTIHNEGTLAIQGGTTLQIDATTGATLDSGGLAKKGSVTFDDNAYNNINTNGSGSTLTNVDNTISGSVHFYNTTIVNRTGGTIDATGKNYQIIIDGSDVLENSGLIEATGAAGLYIGNQVIDSALGGRIVSGAGSLIDLASDTFKGGVISSVGSGQWVLADSGNVLDGSTASGAVTLKTTLTSAGGDTLTLKGTIHNEGALAIQGGTTLQIDATSGAILDSGGLAKKGSVTFDDNAYNNINTNGSSSALTNVDNTISGSVHFYNTKIVNKSGGTIDATGANYQIIIDGTDTLANAGFIEATGAAGLSITGATVNNSGGMIYAATGSRVELASDLITLGTLQTAGTGFFEIADSGVTLSAANKTDGLALEATIQVDNAQMLAISGSVLNTGTVEVGVSSGATLELGATLDGAGSIVLFDSSSSQIVGGFNNVGNTISGAGTISARIQQQSGGTIEATDLDNALILSTGVAIQNGGVFEANHGMLEVEDAVTGVGSLEITDGGTATFMATFNQNVNFVGAFAGALDLTDAYSGKISGFDATDAIELLGLSADSVSLNASNQLVVKSGTKAVALLQLSGNYTGDQFVTKTNASGVEIFELLTPMVAQFLANKAYYDGLPAGFAIVDSAANILANLTPLAADAHIISITSNSGAVMASVANFKTGQAALDKISGGFGISDTAANVTGALGVLSADAANIHSITLTSGTVMVATAQFGADQGLLNSIVGGFSISDTAGNVQADLSALKADAAHIDAITLTKGGVTVAVAGFLGYRAALDKIVGGFTIADTAANFVAGLATIASDLAHIQAFKISGGLPTVTASQAMSYRAVLDEISGGYAISDTAANIQASLASLLADVANIKSIASTTAKVTVNDAVFDADHALLDKVAGGFVVSDTAAAIQADLTALSADSHVVGIVLTSGAITVSVATFKARKGTFDKITGGVTISDTTPNVIAALAALEADVSHIQSVVSTGPTLTVSTTQFNQNRAVLDKIVGGFDVADTAANVAADLTALEADAAHIDAIKLTAGSLTVTVAAFLANQPVLDKLAGGFSISDKAANVVANLATIAADAGHIQALTVTGAVIVSASQAVSARTVLDKIAGGFTISDTATNIDAVLTSLAADTSHIVAIKSTSGSVTVSDAVFEADETLLNKVTPGVVISDTGADIVADLAGLSADSGHIASLVATDGAPSATVAKFKSFSGLLNKVAGGFAISDTAANIQTNFAAIVADTAHISAIASTNTPLKFNGATFVADQTTMDKVTGGVAIADTTSNLIADGQTLLGDLAHIQSVYFTDVGTPTLTLTAVELFEVQPILSKVANDYILDEVTSTVVITTGHGNSLTIDDVPGDDMITGGGTNETFVFGHEFGQAELVDFSSHLSGNTHDTVQLSKADFGSFSLLTSSTSNEASQHGANLWLTAPGDLIVIDNMTMKQLTGASADFKFV